MNIANKYETENTELSKIILHIYIYIYIYIDIYPKKRQQIIDELRLVK